MLTQRLLKQAMWVTLLVGGGALSQEAAISGADFTHGKADAQLSAIGRQAAAQDKTVVVTAPTYWQGKVATKIRAGAHGKPVRIRFSEGFYENVLVRTEAGALPEAKREAAATKAAAKPELKPVLKTTMKPAPVAKPLAKAVAKPHPPQTVAAAESLPQASNKSVTMPLIAPRAAAKPAQKAGSSPSVTHPIQNEHPSLTVAPRVSRQPEVVPIPTATANPVIIKSELPASQGDTAARQHLLSSLNDGRPAAGSIGEAGLQPGDQIYSEDGTLAVVRLEGLHRELYWLQGRVDLQRVEFSPQGGGRYEVTGTIDPRTPAVHRGGAGGAHRVVAAAVPSTDSPTRARLQQQYNNGQSITSYLSVGQLQPEDRLVTDGNTILVVRREGNSMNRYWLNGTIDLGQSGLQKTDANIYRVNGNNLH